jgi:hypothetical protein
MADSIHIVTERLQGVRHSGKGFKALCPAHPDRTPSLSVTEGEDGRVLLHCFAGCALVAVVESMGLGVTDLFPQGKMGHPRKQGLRKISTRDLKEATEFEKQVLFIVKADQATRKPVSKEDWERAKLALQRIALARRFL